MTLPILRSDRLTLRAVTLDDVGPAYQAWLADPAVNRYLETRHAEQTLDKIAAFVKKMQDKPDEFFWAICVTVEDRHIGNIKLGPVNPHHQRADVSLFIGDKAYWGQGYAGEAIGLVTDHAFRDLKLQKLCAGAYTPNIASIAAFEHQGWTREGQQKNHGLIDGESLDSILLGITQADWAAQRGQP